jgi:hypothetical protein
MKKHPTRHRPDPLCTPVGRALALRALRQDMLDIGLACLAVEHASEQRALLSRLAFMIGIGAELAAAFPVQGDNRAGMHQALAEVVRMACDGCTWDAAWAAQMQLALEIAGELMLEHSHHALRMLPSARALADDIAAGRVRADAVAPLEWAEPDAQQHCAAAA